MGEETKKPEPAVSCAEQMSLFGLQIEAFRSQLNQYKISGVEDDGIEDLLAMCDHAQESLESGYWPLRYIGEMLADLGEKIDSLGSRQERFSASLCNEIRHYVQQETRSSLPPPL